MKKEIIDWLIEGPAWIKYAVELQLLDRKPDVGPVLSDNDIETIVERLGDKQVGLPAIKNGKVHYTDTGKAYWDLFLLADVGLTIDEIDLRKEAEEILHRQGADGSFTLPPNVRDNYFCMSAILISSLARMGYRDNTRVKKYVKLIMNSHNTPGWDCYNDIMGLMEACPMDNLNILMLLGQYEQYRVNPRLNGAIDLLLEHWETRDHLYGFGVGRRFMSLQYPAVKYGILRVLDVLSLFPYAVDSRSFHSMIDYVRQKAIDGRYFAESTDGAYAGLDFAQKEQPSRWITFLVNRTEKRADESRDL